MKKKIFISGIAISFTVVAYLLYYSLDFSKYFLSNDMKSREQKCSVLQPKKLQSKLNKYGFDLSDIKSFNNNGKSFPVLLMQNDSSDQVLILIHGKRECPYAMMRGGYRLHQMGYSIMIPVLHGHGNDSLNTNIDYGSFSIDQVLTCVKEAKISGASKIGLIGRSMGASIAIIAAAKSHDVDAIVAECPLKSVESSIEYKHRLYSRLPSFPFLQLKIAITEYKLDANIDSLAAINFIDRISPRPIFIMASLDDKVLNPQDFEDLFKKAKQPKQIWRAAVDHTKFHSQLSDKFYHEIPLFFLEAFND
jgi:esterase/lipase